MENPGFWKTFHRIFAVAGLALLSYGVYSFIDTIIFVNRSTTTQGSVVGVEIETIEDSVLYLPTVTFVTKGGRSIVFTSSTWEGSKWKGRVGESVTVRYVPSDPTNAKIDSFFQLWGGFIIPVVIGGGFIIFGSGMFNRNRDEHPAG